MGDLDRDIRARLDIERTGDPGALKATADDVEALGPAAEKAEEGLDKLAAAVEKFANAPGPAEQKAALLELGDLYVELGRKAVDGFEAGSLEAAALGVVLDEIEARVATFSNGLEGALARGNEAWNKLEKAIATGGEGIHQRLVAMQQAVRDYAAELERAEEAGREVTAEQRAKLDELTEAYRRGTVVAGEYRAAQQQVARDLDKTTEAAGGQARALTSIDGVLRSSGSRWADYALKAGAVVGTFTAFYNIGTKLRDVLNDITDSGFDGAVQKFLGFDAIASRLAGTLDADAEAAGRLVNNLRILAAEGIDTAGLSAVELDRKVQELGKTMQAQRLEAAKSADEQREWAESLDISKAALDKASAALAKNINLFVEANRGLTSANLKEIFGGQIQAVLDDYERIGQEPPEHIQRLASAWGVLSTAAEVSRDRQKVVIEEVRTLLGAAVVDTKQQLDDLVQALPKALEGIDFNQVRLLDGEQIEQARERFQGYLDLFRQAGREIPAELAKAATALGLFVGQAEAVGGAATSFASGADAIAGAGTRIVETVDATGKVIRTLVNDVETVRPAIAGFTDGVSEFADAAGRVAEGGTRIVETVNAAGDTVRTLVNDLSAAPAAADGLTEAVKRQSPEVEALLAKWGEGGTRARELAAAQREAAENTVIYATDVRNATEADRAHFAALGEKTEATKEAADAAEQAAAGTGKVVGAADDQAAAATEAADATREMAEETERLGDSSTTSGIAAITSQFELAQGAIQILLDLAVRIAPAFREAGNQSAGWAAPIIAELGQIETAAKSAYGALQLVAGADTGGAAAPPAGAPS